MNLSFSSLSFKAIATALLFTLGLIGPVIAQSGGTALNLVFTGNGNVMATQTSFENKYNYKTKSFQSGTSTSTGKKPFSGSGYVEITGNMARIKLPSAMVPLLNGGTDGWFSVNDFFMNAVEITGVVRINALNKPKLKIDRNTGIITIANGLGDFAGQCELVKNDPAQRKF